MNESVTEVFVEQPLALPVSANKAVMSLNTRQERPR